VKRLRLLFVIVSVFSLGFGAAFLLFVSDVLPVKQSPITFLPQQNANLEQTATDNFITYVNYDGSKFNPKTVTIKKGNYIAITNKSKNSLMWLVSDNADLNTKRGFGEGERLQLTLIKEGNYKVTNKLDTKALLEVIVLP